MVHSGKSQLEVEAWDEGFGLTRTHMKQNLVNVFRLYLPMLLNELNAEDPLNTVVAAYEEKVKEDLGLIPEEESNDEEPSEDENDSGDEAPARCCTAGDKKSVNDFEEEKLNEDDGDSNNSNLKENVDESASFGRFKKSVAPSSGEYLCVLWVESGEQLANYGLEHGWGNKDEEIALFKCSSVLGVNSLLVLHSNSGCLVIERFLSDHRPILLRESAHDYGPVPFRFFHHWIHLEGFNDFVTSTWNSAPSVDSNGMRNLAGKLKFLKAHIKIWIKDNKSETVSTIANLKKELNQLDAVIDKGTGTEVEAEKRMEVLAALRTH
ncbi:hypothetical protein Tco_0216102 [Tanacetum coccineum]